MLAHSFFAVILIITAWTSDGKPDVYAFPVKNRVECATKYIDWVKSEVSGGYEFFHPECLTEMVGDKNKS